MMHHFFRILQILMPVAVLVYAQTEIELTCLEGTTTASCQSFVATFCETIDVLSFSGGDSGSRCFNLPSDSDARCDFTTHSFVTTVGTPAESSCEDTLTAIITDCETGGIGNVVGGTFTFAVEPNAGACLAFV